MFAEEVRFNSFKSVLLTSLNSSGKPMRFYLIAYLLLLGQCLVAAQTDSSTGDDTKGDGEEIPPPPKQLTCDFGTGQELTSCNFDFLNATSHPNIRWKLGTGQTAFWLGGPLKDRTTMENTGKTESEILIHYNQLITESQKQVVTSIWTPHSN